MLTAARTVLLKRVMVPVLDWSPSSERVVRCGLEATLMDPVRLLSAGQLMTLTLAPVMVAVPLKVEQEETEERSASEAMSILLAQLSM